MPKTQDILNTLQSIANDYSAIAIVWHFAIYLMIALLITKWQLSNKSIVLLICLPILSVAIFAWLSGNPFNGTLFSILTILVFIFGLKISSTPLTYSSMPFLIVGIIMVIFGLVYPHFLHTDSFIKYLYSSPVGLIPCPTLSLIIGFALIYNGFGSNSITFTLIAFGLFYSVFGILKLAVYLDLFLLFGTVTLLIKYILSIRNPVV
jgi:hypothetical protein